MSIEGGSIGTVSAGVAPSIGGSFEGFSSVSPSISSPGLSGGSVFEGVSAGGLFSETSPFMASVASTPEMPIAKSVDIFSNSDFKTLGEVKLDPISSPIVDIPGFREFSPSIQSVPEKPLTDFKFSEFTTIASNPIIVEIQDIAKTPEVLSEASKGDIDVVFESVKINKEPINEQVVGQESIPVQEVIGEVEQNQSTNQKQAAKVASLFETTGLYTKSEAKEIVGKILSEEKQGVAEVLNAEPEVQTQKQIGAKVAFILHELEALQKEDEEKEKKLSKAKSKLVEKKPLKEDEEKMRLPSLEVDNRAQSERKSTLKSRISEIFNMARSRNLNKVYGKEIVEKIEEKIQHKSQLLLVKGFAKVPDGSFHEVVNDVKNLKSVDTSFTSEVLMRKIASNIIDAKPAVKITDESPKDKVSKTDVERVVKYVNSPISNVT